MAGVLALAQQNPSNQPNVFLENKSKPGKGQTTRTISGSVRDQSDQPIRGAIVQLKDMRTSKVIDYPTKEDGKFVFRELSMSIDYQLTASHGDLKLMKKVSPYDTRNNIDLTFKLEPAKPEQQ